MDLNEIKSRITELLYNMAPSLRGQIWKAIHEIEKHYQAEVKKLQEDLHLCFDDLLACKFENLELREKISSMQKVIEGGVTGDVQKFCEGVNAQLEAIARKARGEG